MEPPKLGFIDSLRGFAALYVLLFHFSLITTPTAVAPRWLAPFTGLGGSGVTLFFIVSAFTLCLSTDTRKQDESTPLLNYYLRRLFRIAPLFYVWIVLYCIRDKLVFDVVHSPAEIARSLFFMLNLSPGHEQGFVWASWTIGVEMLFYVFFPAIFRLTSNVGRAFAFFIATLMARSIWHAAVPYFVSDQTVAATYYNLSLLHHLPTFAFGIAVYRIYKLLDIDRVRRNGLGELLTVGAVVLLISLAYGQVQTGIFDALTVEAAIYGALLIGLAIKAPVAFVNRITRFYGKISYSVYLSHATTLFLMSKLFAIIYSHSAYVTVAYFLSIAAGMAVVTLLSWFTYTFVETPGNRLGKAAIRAIQRRRATSLTT
ncbi:acyltransferase family protein [Burkholderia stagnalis]|uniref:acyltransferase family protein n=1 Tax=Burkholderia stagnalis TaxID=1503054 RepID=UPI000F57DB6E|nr:acyltransferase [Burkholderia stagnalis]RQQ50620.1 acyltransferase [Burkholderia stagnalis]RQY01392.1 acyltransferase [Burkholderia stagnalis]RQY17061.1 acyltransferase [Burkholderia stagnalis]RQY30671.1 acyltransferase [Burkholderia stagnalis]